MSPDDRPAGPIARSDVTLQRVGREAILRDGRNGKTHVINGTAAQLWELCDGRPMADLVSDFGAIFGRGPDLVADDVERTLARFQDLGLIA
jgi:PqqD family protein of HPr-rel-A system